MKSFQFPLQKALEWRRLQLELEENRYKQLVAALAEIDRTRAELEVTGIGAKVQVCACSPLAGRDLAMLAQFCDYVDRQQSRLAVRRAEYQRQLEAQQRVMLEARRRCRLLERLRDQRRLERLMESDREIEQFASECYLAGVARRRGHGFCPPSVPVQNQG